MANAKCTVRPWPRRGQGSHWSHHLTPPTLQLGGRFPGGLHSQKRVIPFALGGHQNSELPSPGVPSAAFLPYSILRPLQPVPAPDLP